MHTQFQYEKVSVQEAANAMEPACRRGFDDRAFSRSVAPAMPIVEATVAWLAGLPAEFAPRELARAFPRVADKLCKLWKRPSQCDVYFRDLIMNDRPVRAGFPPPVMKELGMLLAHHADVYPTPRLLWNDVRKR